MYRKWPLQTSEWYPEDARSADESDLTNRAQLERSAVSTYSQPNQHTYQVSILVFMRYISQRAEIGLLEGDSHCIRQHEERGTKRRRTRLGFTHSQQGIGFGGQIVVDFVVMGIEVAVVAFGDVGGAGSAGAKTEAAATTGGGGGGRRGHLGGWSWTS